MHTILTLQVTIGEGAFQLHGHCLDARLIAILQGRDAEVIAVRLGPAHIHTHQHRRPVLCLGATSTRIDLEHAVHIVGLLAEHVLQLQLLYSLESGSVGGVQLGLGDEFVLAELEGHFHLVGEALHLLVAVDPSLQLLHLLHLRLCLLGIVPESRYLRTQLLLLYLYLLVFNRQIAIQRLCALLNILQLVKCNHLNF